jgi:hypothetical protein
MTISDIPAGALPYADELFSQPPGRPQEERDRWKRRLITHPYTGEKVPWTAVSTFIGALKDSEGLLKWTGRMIVTGLGRDEALWMRAAGTEPGDIKSLDQIAEEAKRGAGAFAGANRGTAMHGFQDRVDRGVEVNVPSAYVNDIEAYQAEMARQGLEPDLRYQERFVLIPQYQLIGRIDGAWWRNDSRPMMDTGYPEPELYIGDRKTKQQRSRKSWYEEAAQLGLYSLATHFYDPETNTTEPITPVLGASDPGSTTTHGRPWNMNAGVIIHAPIGSGLCQVMWANLNLGRQVAAVAHALRVLRTKNDYVRPMEPLHTD